MVYKYLFYFISWFNKKIDILRGTDEYCYYAASALVGMTIAVSLYAAINVVSIVIIRSKCVYEVLSIVMDVFCLILSLLSFLYFRHNSRWEIIYKEIQQSAISHKYRYGICCLLYVLITYGLWFFSNDIIRELITGEGSLVVKKIVEILNITHW